MSANRLKTEYLPKALIVTALLPAVVIPLMFAYVKYSWGAPLPFISQGPREVAILILALVRQAAGMAFSLSLALLALAYYGKRSGLEVPKRRFILAGRAFACVITANTLLGAGIAAKSFFIPTQASTVLADGTINRTVSRTFTLGGAEMLNWLAVVVAVLLIVDLVDETLRLREESSLTV